MQRFRQQAARAFKLLAGQEPDEPLGAHVYAVYSFLFMAAMLIFPAWVAGAAG